MYVYPFFCINGKVQKQPLKNNGLDPIGRPTDSLQGDTSHFYFTSYSGIGSDSPDFMAASSVLDFSGSSHQ